MSEEKYEMKTVEGYTLSLNEAAIVVDREGSVSLFLPRSDSLISLPVPFMLLTALYMYIMDKPEILDTAMDHVRSKSSSSPSPMNPEPTNTKIVH